MTAAQQSTQPPAYDLPWLGQRSFAECKKEFDREGYLIFERVLTERQIEDIRAALKPHLEEDIAGRNNFEGFKSNRVYSLIAKSPVFADLATHPLALAFAEADLGESCLLSALLAINLHPGETVQPWHIDDGHCQVELPRPSWGVSAFWAIDAMTETNGATEFIPRSHSWDRNQMESTNIRTLLESRDETTHPDARQMLVPEGSLMLAKGTLMHRGGANASDAPRLLITPQYCMGWMRQLENMVLTMPEEQAAKLPQRARELLGYSIHPPFMGYVNGMHPSRNLTGDGTRLDA